MPSTKPRTSQISRHPERVMIERSRIAGVALDRIAEKFGVKRDAIWRHMDSLPDAYKAALIDDIPLDQLTKRAAEEKDLSLDHFKFVRTIVEQQLVYAKSCNDSAAVANLTRAAIAANRQVGKITGEIEKMVPGMTFTGPIAIFNNPAFQELEAGLIRIAKEVPAAKPHLLDLIQKLKAVPPAGPMIEGSLAHA